MDAEELTPEEQQELQELIEALVAVTKKAARCCPTPRTCCGIYSALFNLIAEFAPDRTAEFIPDFS
jgi:hypothetical protein